MSRRSHIALFFLVFTLGFNGLYEGVGISSGSVKFVVFSVCCLFVTLELLGRRRFTLPVGVFVSVFFSFGVWLSLFSSGSYYSPITLLAAFQIYAPLILLGLLSTFLHKVEISLVTRLATVFMVLQLLASLVKFARFGQMEGMGIGTISVQAGSLSTFIVVLFVTVGCCARRTWVVALAFLSGLLFSVINEKRLGLIIVVVAFALWGLIRVKDAKSVFGATVFIVPVTVISFGAMYLAPLAIESLLDGRESSEFLSRVLDYLLQTDSAGEPIGRVAGILHFVGLAFEPDFFFGGPDPLFAFGSSLGGVESSQSEMMFRPSAALIIFMRVGLFGLLCWLAALYYLLSRLDSRFFILVAFVWVDFFVYSDNSLLSYFYIFSLFIAGKLSIEHRKSLRGDETQAAGAVEKFALQRE